MNKKTVSITLNGEKISAPEGMTILKAAESAGITIPTICYHEELTPPGLCRQCVVEVEGSRVLKPACITEVQEKMVVHTNSEKVKRVRRTNLEMLSASSDLSESPEIIKQMLVLGADKNRFSDTEMRVYPLRDDNPFYVRDYTKCILCQRCVQVCSSDVQFSYALVVGGRGYESRITTFYDKDLPETTCVFCGNCIQVCPTGALLTKEEYTIREAQNDKT